MLLIRTILTKGGNVNIEDEQGVTPVLNAYKSGFFNILLELFPLYKDFVDSNGNSIWHRFADFIPYPFARDYEDKMLTLWLRCPNIVDIKII